VSHREEIVLDGIELLERRVLLRTRHSAGSLRMNQRAGERMIQQTLRRAPGFDGPAAIRSKVLEAGHRAVHLEDSAQLRGEVGGAQVQTVVLAEQRVPAAVRQTPADDLDIIDQWHL